MQEILKIEPHKVGTAFQKMLDFVTGHSEITMTIEGVRAAVVRMARLPGIRVDFVKSKAYKMRKDRLIVRFLAPKFPKPSKTALRRMVRAERNLHRGRM